MQLSMEAGKPYCDILQINDTFHCKIIMHQVNLIKYGKTSKTKSLSFQSSQPQGLSLALHYPPCVDGFNSCCCYITLGAVAVVMINFIAVTLMLYCCHGIFIAAI